MTKKRILSLVLICLLVSVLFYGCGSKTDDDDVNKTTSSTSDKNNTSNNDNDPIALRAELNAKEAEAKADVEGAEKIEKEDIHTAVEYLQTNLKNPIADTNKDIIHKMAYYSAYLKYAARENVDAANHDIVTLADKTRTYIENIYTKTEDEANDASTKLKAEIDEIGNRLTSGKDKMVNEFHEMINR